MRIWENQMCPAPSRWLRKVLVMLSLVLAGCFGGSHVKPAAGAIALEPLPGTFAQPLLVTHTDAHPEALFIVEKTGRIRVVQNGTLLPQALLDIRGQVSQGYEQGLLGLAFHPKFAENGWFFVNYTDRNGNTQIVRYQVEPDSLVADPSSAQVIMTIEQPAANHNGGMLAFGPDGYLYIATGDGGRAGDPWGNAQNLGTLLGKILRIDVDNGDPYAIPETNPFAGVAGARPEIWAYGLRNPWRFSFDRATGDLYIADVGQNNWEEVNWQPAGSAGGENYGWNIMEGTHCYPASSACNKTGLVLPIIEYAHTSEHGCSITGGHVYRGEQMPEWYGHYFFADYCSGQIWAANVQVAKTLLPFESVLATNMQISSFGEDAAGELYITDLSSGRVYRLVSSAGR